MDTEVPPLLRLTGETQGTCAPQMWATSRLLWPLHVVVVFYHGCPQNGVVALWILPKFCYVPETLHKARLRACNYFLVSGVLDW